MSCSILFEKEEEEEYEGSQLEEQGIPVCGANLSSPVVDQANYIDEIHYNDLPWWTKEQVSEELHFLKQPDPETSEYRDIKLKYFRLVSTVRFDSRDL